MVDDKPEAMGSPPDLSRNKRTPPTIDLEATEVSEATAKEEASANDASDNSSTTSASSDRASNERADAADKPVPTPARPHWLPIAVVAALVGALATCAIIAAATLAGWPQAPVPAAVAPQSNTTQIDALANRLAKIEAQPAPSTTIDSAAVARIAALEQATTTLRNEFATLRSQGGQLAATVNDLKVAPRDGSPPDLSAITARLNQIESAARAQSAETTQHNAAPVDDKPLRRIVAMSLLDQQARRGDPYVAALTAAKPLMADPEALKPLERFAASGVPSANTLSKELLALIAELTPAEIKPAEGAGIIDRLQAGAERLVRIRRTDAPGGDGRTAVVSHIAAAARRDDVTAARREMNGLSATQRAALQPWIARADAREATLAASRQLATDAIAALNKPAQ